MLTDNNFKEITRSHIIQILHDCNDLDIFEKWEFLKAEIRTLCINYSKSKAKKGQEHAIHLSQSLQILKDELPVSTYKNEIAEAIFNIEADIDRLKLEKLQSSIFRVHTQFAKEGERNTKFFFALLKL